MKGSKTLFSSKSDEWATPDGLFKQLNEQYFFTLDPASTHENAKCAKHYTKEEDGLQQSWRDEIVFLNCPYSQVSKWVEKCYNEWLNNGATVVALLPARTDTKWFHSYCYSPQPHRRLMPFQYVKTVYDNNSEIRIEFLKGRLKFSNSKNSAPFPSMLVIWQ